MGKFEYVALDGTGQESTGVIEAKNQTEAIGMIREKGLFPTNIAESGSASGGGSGSVEGARKAALQVGKGKRKKGIGGTELNINIPGLGGVKQKQLTTFTRQMATLIDAGLPLVRGLHVLERQEKNPVLKKPLGKSLSPLNPEAHLPNRWPNTPKCLIVFLSIWLRREKWVVSLILFSTD